MSRHEDGKDFIKLFQQYNYHKKPLLKTTIEDFKLFCEKTGRLPYHGIKSQSDSE
jgi:hypothetical protein